MPIELTSNAFDAGETIPVRYTCDGDDISPPLHWRTIPDEAQSLVLICDDPDSSNGPWAHWVLYDIPPELVELPEGVPRGGRLSWGGTQGRNTSGDVGYGGPCPPRGPAHHYYFRLYALDEPLDLPPGATRQQVIDRMQGHILDRTELMGLYARR
jgi:Raf kinase inhibitor-like YbhB/YbcL family protein